MKKTPDSTSDDGRPDLEWQAAEWVTRRDGVEPSEEASSDFDAWLRSDPQARAVFDRLERGWRRADSLKRVRPIDGPVDPDLLQHLPDQAERDTKIPDLLLQSIVTTGPRTDEGLVIAAVMEPWFDIVKELTLDPAVMHQIDWRKWEEIIAGAYVRAHFDEVVLTPRSGDRGRDIIAVKRGLGTIRIIDQFKAFTIGHLVNANDVRALMGVLQTDGACKGFLTTTSGFAPRLREDPLIKPFLGQRLELISGDTLLRRLKELGKRD